jgi:hypothetical protein
MRRKSRVEAATLGSEDEGSVFGVVVAIVGFVLFVSLLASSLLFLLVVCAMCSVCVLNWIEVGRGTGIGELVRG